MCVLMGVGVVVVVTAVVVVFACFVVCMIYVGLASNVGCLGILSDSLERLSV